MKVEYKKILAGLVLILSVAVSKSQQYGGNRPSYGDMPKTGEIKGKILEKETNVPMEYANVIIYRVNDSTMVTGTISGKTGDFEIKELPNGRYYVTANFIGYDKEFIKDVRITPNSGVIDLGTIYLKPSTVGIDAVEVVSERPQVEYKIDKKVVSVNQDITAAGGTAIDVLENVPSIQTDIEGNISLRGSSNFTVYIDGRPSILEGSDALQQIPASAIENIEIITNPSAKYDAEGTAGIINVVMKKRKGQGLNGIVNTSIGTNGKYGADILLNYRSDKYNIYGGVDYNKRKFSMEADMFEKSWDTVSLDPQHLTYRIDTTYEDNRREMNNERGGTGFKLGFDYFLSDKSTLSFSGAYDYRIGDRVSESWRDELLRDTLTQYYTNSYSSSKGDNYELNIDYVNKFNENGHELSASFNFEGETGGRDEGLLEYIIESQQLNENINYNIRDDNPEYEIRFKADYINPYSEHGKIEAGLQYDGDYSHYDYQFQEDLGDGVFRDVDSLSQILDINRGVYSAYGLFTNRFLLGIDYQLGLRVEYTNREVIADKLYLIKRPDFFPSVHISKVFNDHNQLMVNYTRRINRPREWALNPITRFWDTETTRKGNPALEPEFTNSYEVNYQYSFNRSFVAFELYHRHNINLIDRNLTRLPDGKRLMSDLNVGESFSTGFEIMSNLVIKKFLVLNASYSLYNYKLDSPIRNENVDDEKFSWRARMNATVNTPWKGRIQLNSFYNASSITSQGERGGFFVFNAGYRQDFFDRKLTATLQARDIFRSMNFKSISYLDNAIIESEFRRESPIITLTMSYKINNYKTRDRQRNGEGFNGDSNGGGEIEMDF